ncbi:MULTISPECIES: TetR/AcrR family transcriptional regulator [unclassified Nesterenkonia]|uniref:TetR/AcrR family transcriptional regulator n=1 Tax=unclassified Nesterenkonia TaxID=2629769 RepID=UPI000873314B|nr:MULTISPECIES: TetR/AcrR family transcriptional regulator [unclassified Nesterenkonia]MDS2172484.1 TetR/AcrR family transcriptional regulator [Nesterenkonia sp. CL21]OSM44541.1 TetR family transcriptional regulator [Nesterenkonia sp. PF2B19]
MVSRVTSTNSRKAPGERRDEIIAEAARLAVTAGLEKITLRAVAAGIDVRPGLISHYFPTVEDLLVVACERALSDERTRLIPAEGAPLTRLARMIARLEGGHADDLARLWLNARHLSRHHPRLGEALVAQEEQDRERLMGLIRDGIAEGAFPAQDPFAACVRIFVAVDGAGAYVNSPTPFDHVTYHRFITDVAQWALGITDDSLRQAVDCATAELIRP